MFTKLFLISQDITIQNIFSYLYQIEYSCLLYKKKKKKKNEH